MTERQAFVGLGSNIGDRVGHVVVALARLAEAAQGRLVCCSPLYRTEPVGVTGHDWYLNGVAEVATAAPPEVILHGLLALEAAAGRVRPVPGAPRTIDLDLLLVGECVVATALLTLPHPRLHERRFVLMPLCDIAPNTVHPLLGRTASELLAALPPGPTVERLDGDALLTVV